MTQIQAVLFDLDGTLVDTAPDLGYALNLQRGLPQAGLTGVIARPKAVAIQSARPSLLTGLPRRRCLLAATAWDPAIQ